MVQDFCHPQFHLRKMRIEPSITGIPFECSKFENVTQKTTGFQTKKLWLNSTSVQAGQFYMRQASVRGHGSSWASRWRIGDAQCCLSDVANIPGRSRVEARLSYRMLTVSIN